MSKPIQLIPPGLLGLLQLKQGGRNPNELLETVQATIDLRDWYFQSRTVDATTLIGGNPSIALTVPGNFVFTANPATVPNGQFWYVFDYTIDALIATAADSLRIAPCWIANNNVAPVQRYLLGPDANDIVSARANRHLMAKADHGFWLPPGAALGVEAFDVLTGTSITVTAHVRAVPLSI